MTNFKISEPNKKVKYVKAINTANGTLEFTEDQSKALYRDSGFFAESERDYLNFHFKKKYPELAYMTISSSR